MKPTLKIHFLSSCVLLALFSSATQSAFAQAGAAALNPPLNFGNNFFVTGDYIVAGAYNVNQKFTTLPNGVSYTVGTINVPDQNKGVPNPGITGATKVPTGAQIVAALLYWQTVEKVGVAPGAPGSGQNGYFLPVANAASFPKGFPGYAISGTNVSGSTPVSWSSGGCNSGSTGKILRTYRADVTGGLPVDASGNSIANGSFQVLLPSTGNATPLTLGATLVVIYRIPTGALPQGAVGPNAPLNAIVIYDGDYAQSNTMLTMTQPLQGFYDADHSPVSRLTHIVGSGQSNKFQTVYLGKDANTLTKLPSLYPKLPAFPGWYGTWDNPTWTFPSASTPVNPLLEDYSTATTQVVPSPMNQGCVSWGAIIVSTTVKNSDNDGILYSWKTNQGYCDVALNPSCSGPGDPAWVDLTGAVHGHQDVFLQYDYMCSSVVGPGSCDVSTQRDALSAAGAASGGTTTYTGTITHALQAGTVVRITGFTNQANNGQFAVVSASAGTLMVNNPSGVAEPNLDALVTYAIPGDVNYSFDPRLAIDSEDGKIVHDNAVDKVVEAYANHGIHLHAFPGNAILEGGAGNPVSCADTDPTCTFPNEPGTVGFREGLAYIKNTNILTSTGVIGGCTVGTDAGCVPVFQHGKKDSYHYALFSHGVGLPSWFLSDGSLVSAKQSGNTVTFTTSSPHGISQITTGTGATANDNSCLLGRVTVVFAITNPNLEGTFCVLANPAPTANTFSITVGGNATNFTYTAKTDPNLSVANGQVTSMSGYSDVGGQNSVVSLGYGGWGPPNNPFSEGNKWQIKAGTFMHELGHTMALTHGGTFYNKLGNNPVDYTPNFEVNCKSNVQTSMSYLFQFDLLQTNGLYKNNQPIKVVDYSEDPQSPLLVNTLTENVPQGTGFLSNLTYPYTSWFQLTSYNGATPATSHCDGSPIGAGESSYSYTNDSVSNFFWSATNPPGITGNDINFNGSTSDVMDPHNEWEGTPAQNGVGPSPGVDLQQVSSVGTVSTTGVGGEAGGLKPQGGGGGLKPQGGGGGLKPQGGGGGLKPAGGGGGLKPQGGGGLKAEITHGQANSYAHPPEGLFIVQEEASPRLIDLTWFAPTIGTAVQYNIFRSDAGGPFNLIHSNVGNPPASSFQDTVTCNLGGYRYRITAVTLNDQGQQQISSPSNTAPAFGQPLLTGCYTVSSFTVPGSAVQGNTGVQISWTLTDDFYIFNPGDVWAHAQSGNQVTRQAANTLVAIGPDPNNCANTTRTKLVADGVPTQAGIVNDNPAFVDTFAGAANAFTFTWNRTDGFCAGSYSFELDLDHVNGSPAQTQTAATALQLAIDINDQDIPHIDTLSLPDATVGVAYSNTLTEHGGVGGLTWSISAGSLPPGFGINPTTGEISQFATTAGTYQFTAKVTDSKGNTGTQNFTLKVHIWVSASAAPGSPPFTANPNFPAMTVGVSSPDTIYQSGAVGAVTWSITSSSLPSGITLNSGTGVLSGFAATAGTYQFTVLATDSQGNTGTLAFTLIVHIWVSASAAPGSPPFTANPNFPAMTVGVSSPDTVYQSGAVGAVTWSISQNSPPTGITLNANTGVLSGFAATAGTYQFTVLATDSQGNTGTLVFTLVVNIFVSTSQPALPYPFTATTLLADAIVGVPYSNTVYEDGGVYDGTHQFTWTVVGGSVPSGLSFAPNAGGATNGTLAGTTMTPGIYNFTAMVTDSLGNTGMQILTLRVLIFVSDTAPPAVPPFTASTTLPDAIVGIAYNNTVYESGGVNDNTTPFTWTIVAGNLPGLSFQPNGPPAANGTLSGTPTTPGTFAFTAQVTDSAGNIGTQNFTLTVRVCSATPSGLVSWYPFNGNALDIHGGKPGTLAGAGGTFVPAEVNQGFKSGGEGSVITVPGAAYLNPVNFSVGAWIRVDTVSNDPTMLVVWQGDSKGTDLSTPYSLGVQGTPTPFVGSPGAQVVGTSAPGKAFAILSDGTNELDVFSNTVLTPGVFYYVTLTWSGPSVGASLYVNGVLETSSGNTHLVGLAPPVNPFQIGGILNGTTDSFNGVIDELQIWGTPLTQPQITAIYNAAEAGQCSTLWFSEEHATKVGRINLGGSGVSGFPVATAAGSNPYGLAAGPDGNVWFTEYGTANIAMITPSGTITEFPTLTVNSGPIGITSGPDGNLWFADYGASAIGKITTSGTVTESLTIGTNPYAITAGPDGNLWFTELNGNMIGKITTSGALTEYPIPTASSTPSGITAGPDGNIWFTELNGNKIGVITPAGVITEYSVLTAGSQPTAITVGADGNLWFTEAAGNQIGKINVAGVITEYPVTTANSQPFAIALGLDGNVWFTESQGNNIGKITPGGVVTEFPISDPNSFPLGITVGP